MNRDRTPTPLSVLLPVSVGTGLSLIGDASLYAVLPTHAADAGITLASAGVILSANRFVRLLLNGPAGVAYDRWRRRPLFVAALFLGALSTALYGLTSGFWPLLCARLVWGLSWAGIWVGGNTMIADICDLRTRGRWIGLYQISFFLGTASGSIAGGLLTDALGYHSAMGIGAGLTMAGAVAAFLFLPETSPAGEACGVEEKDPEPPAPPVRAEAAQMASAVGLMGVNRLTVAGMLSPTLGLLLLETFGHSVSLAGRTIGVASLTGVALGISYIVSMGAAPLMGRFSDRIAGRWGVVVGGLTPGVAGFGLLAFGYPLSILFGLPLAAFGSGSNQGLSTAIVGDLAGEGERGRKMGTLFTAGDLMSAIGPLLAYSMIPIVGLRGVYLLCCALLAGMMLVALKWALRRKPGPRPTPRTPEGRSDQTGRHGAKEGPHRPRARQHSVHPDACSHRKEERHIMSTVGLMGFCWAEHGPSHPGPDRGTDQRNGPGPRPGRSRHVDHVEEL